MCFSFYDFLDDGRGDGFCYLRRVVLSEYSRVRPVTLKLYTYVQRPVQDVDDDDNNNNKFYETPS